ncbi:MAG: hypothetical protein HFG54_07410 [Lachnospiraceae bacterium]|nr:hypothetical protein [Lachnospiraceae bacterium]
MNDSFMINRPSLYASGSLSYGMGAEITRQIKTEGPDNISGQEKLPPEVRLPGQDTTKEPGRSPAAERRPDLDTYECETCKNRKYQDGSNDPSVSFKTPTRLSPERAAFAIRAHEAEHVAHARVKAQKEDQEIVSQSVTYHTGICPECGRTYMSGGTTRTTFRSTPVVEEKPVEKGRYVDVTI